MSRRGRAGDRQVRRSLALVRRQARKARTLQRRQARSLKASGLAAHVRIAAERAEVELAPLPSIDAEVEAWIEAHLA